MMSTLISVRFSSLYSIQEEKKPSKINSMFYVIVYFFLAAYLNQKTFTFFFAPHDSHMFLLQNQNWANFTTYKINNICLE